MLELSRIRSGHWEGIWAAPAAPVLAVEHMAQVLPGLVIEPQAAGKWRLRLPIPAEVLSDGVQTFLLRQGDEVVGRFTIITGVPLEDDLRAEIDLLRAELDMLKRAFRRHCAESGG